MTLDLEQPYNLIHGDCLVEMDRIPTGSVDAIIADWPYGVTSAKWDSVIPLEPLWEQCKRVIKRNGAIVLTAGSPFNYTLWASNRRWFKYEWVWNKKQSGSFQNAKYAPLKITEYVMVFGEGNLNYSPQMRQGIMRKRGGAKFKSRVVGDGWRDGFENWGDLYYPVNIIEIPNPRANKLHPTEKPVALMEYLIKTYTNPGDLVLDNTMGSGSTGEACLNTGRRFIGIEKDEGYFRIGQERMERVALELRATQIEMGL